jgi:anaerobic ribonucleoside-triphosphate reductase activating protein
MQQMQKYAAIKANDIVDIDEGICVSFWTQGCPHRCKGCHNPETWDFNGGKEFTEETMEEIIRGLKAQGIKRNYCVMGGEPLCDENAYFTFTTIWRVKYDLPDTLVYVWTGYTFDELLKSDNIYIKEILKYADFIIDGPYIESERDITLDMRGSRNQKIIDLRKIF